MTASVLKQDPEKLDDIFCLVELFSAWKNVGMMVTCNRCDVMPIM